MSTTTPNLSVCLRGSSDSASQLIYATAIQPSPSLPSYTTITRSAQYAVSVIKQSSVRPSVCPVDQQQRRSAGLLLSSA